MSIANGICDQSGFKVKLKRLKGQWDSARVLPDWRDPRPKQLQVPSVRENMFVANMRPEQQSVFTSTTQADILQQIQNNGL
jgi:hypothetical protein